jgi:transaldolase
MIKPGSTTFLFVRLQSKSEGETMNPLLELRQHGQSIWLDFIERQLLESGGLLSLIETDGVRGVTSNPSIFEKAIDSGTEYDRQLTDLLADNPRATARELYDAIAIEDVRRAADILRPWYDASDATDGFVSLEPPPQLTRNTADTLSEVHRVWRAVDRPNLMVKVVATPSGIKAVEALIAEGININITLMFSVKHYEAVTRAYIRGLERCARPERVASVASFFVSRVDTQVDKVLEAKGSREALGLRGRIAIANTKMVYRRFQEIFHGDEFSKLRSRGARVQRPLWASTSTKNPSYRDVLYVEELIGSETVNTLPPATLEAFRNHGQVRGDTVAEGWAEAEQQLRLLGDLGIDLDAVAEQLQVDGIKSFADAYAKVVAALDRKRDVLAPAGRSSSR